MTQGNLVNYGVGAFYSYERTSTSQNVPAVGGVYDYDNSWGFSASRSSSLYGSSNTVTPLSRTVIFLIRF